MMQTLLTNSPAAPTAAAADKSAVLTASQDGGEGALQSDGKVGFSEVMNRVQQAGKVNAKGDGKVANAGGKAPNADSKVPARPGAEQGSAGALEGNKPVPTAKGEAAKSLANEAEEAAGADDKPQKGSEPDPALAPNDFLQRLQDALKQDTSLVAPPAINLVATAPVVETDGKMLPHKDADAESAEASATLTQPLAGSGDKPGATTSAAALARQAASLLTGETSVPVDAKAAQPDAVVTDDAALAAQLQGAGKESGGKESGAGGANADQPADNNGKETKGSKSELSAAERAALLSKVPAAALSEQGENDTRIQLEGADKGAKPVVPPMAGKEEPVKTAPLQATHQAVATQPGAARAFEEGVTRTDGGSSSAAADKAPTQTTAEGDGQSKPVAAKAEGQPAPAASSGAPAPATAPASEPVLVAPQQVLASSEPQGPQASLASLSAGLKQMEATERSDAPRARSEVKVDVKQKVAELARGGAQESNETTTTPESSRSQQVQQNSQPQAVGHDNRPAATEAAARREPANLPHLKLADPEAPAQLHQKVNLMLADKLQQAEIQLDPLGLGKMKIQIQMGADSQANVHFVVQHGQTREMLEQAMPRLRDMLAGQGIQLGQTLVQQQPQQQSQGQSAFAGQGQQGQKGSGSFAETGQTEAEVTGAGMRLSTESTNDSGIDFYA
ncbi:TPA: flagellar hook-length control protein FliK [Aeromonas hydrophila]|uniref:flagellar hook-length control protein FliK n=1 Tax=Aeromonas TaxID=642 RepID=UPI00090C068B|nr:MULTISPECIES: flagellar hook-length control protein FliK [Aeromonas]HEB4991999.1 flagellar hook-length control protein FliK [Aeromonas hydrophila subsp. hydrophila]APJ14617.1 flagellar hook-length control protein FliK [Aeromonas hydrophila]BBT07497.1 flagellar hook-length control protein FliK [Aeromonas hydrophila]HEB5044668.1 flagellar hook-length control protein FliK [Aeromonas hydrophila subsp. hydrophila]HEB5075790.1 flagellar hook-length control protein FliK [Aeromonas hydrophila subsp